MADQIERDVYVLSNKTKIPIDYVRLTNDIPIVLTFQDYDIPSGAAANVFVQKPSGTAVYASAEISGNIVTITVTDQMFAELGKAQLQIRITQGKNVLVSFAQPVRVHPNYTEGDAAESTNEGGFFRELEEAINDANTAADSANTAASAANTAADNANTAASAANAAVDSANTAADNANTAADNANSAASAANAAAELANTAADSANTAADSANSVANGMVTVREYVIQQGQRAEAAANQAEAAVEDLAQRVADGEFDGAPGPQGPPGKDGEDGADGVIITITASQIAMQIQNGDLYLYYSDENNLPGYSIQDGNLILSIE